MIRSERLFAFSALLAGLVSLAGCGVSFTGDITPPPNQEGTYPAQMATATQPVVVQVEPADALSGYFSVTGVVTNGAGASVPQGFLVTLEIFQLSTGSDDMQNVEERTSSIEEGQSFRFDQVPLVSDYIYLVTAEYQGLIFNSDFIQGIDIQDGAEARLPLTLYESTTDTSQLTVERLHIIFDFQTPGRVQIAEMFVISNPTGYVVVPPAQDASVLDFVIPPQAEDIQFGDGAERYVQTDTGFGDRQVIGPGDANQVIFGYSMPYTGGAGLEFYSPLPVEDTVVLLPKNGVSLTSEMLQASGERSAQGETLLLYTGSGFEKSESLMLTLSGQPSGVASSSSGVTTGLIIGLAAVGVALAGGGLWMYQRQKRNEQNGVASSQEVVEEEETLLDAVIALDDRYRAGELDEEVYQQRRMELKEKIRVLQQTARPESTDRPGA